MLSLALSLSPSLYSSLHSQQIALRLIKLLPHSSHLGSGLGLRSMPHALLTLSALPSARPIKPLVSLQSCLPHLTLVIVNENKVEGFSPVGGGEKLPQVCACCLTNQACDVQLIWNLGVKIIQGCTKMTVFHHIRLIHFLSAATSHHTFSGYQKSNYVQFRVLHGDGDITGYWC